MLSSDHPGIKAQSFRNYVIDINSEVNLQCYVGHFEEFGESAKVNTFGGQ